MDALERDREWTLLLTAAIDGDEEAYGRFLTSVSKALRATVRRRVAAFGMGSDETEDVLQETLLAIHLKRHTWAGSGGSAAAWVFAIARNKLVDVLRRRGRRAEVPLDQLGDAALAAEGEQAASQGDLERLVGQLDARQQDIVRSISIAGHSIRETAERLKMSEVAVRVALHRSIKALAAIYRKGGGE